MQFRTQVYTTVNFFQLPQLSALYIYLEKFLYRYQNHIISTDKVCVNSIRPMIWGQTGSVDLNESRRAA